MTVHDYDEGFKVGYQKGIVTHHRYAWTKLFCLVFIAAFFAFDALAALATFL